MNEGEPEKAKAWRVSRGLTMDSLAAKTGYTKRMIVWMEKGLSPPGPNRKEPAPTKPWIWRRYKMMCAGVERELRMKRSFDWE